LALREDSVSKGLPLVLVRHPEADARVTVPLLPSDEHRHTQEHDSRENAGEDSGEEQVADVLLCGDAKHDQRNRWRNEDAQRSRSSYETCGELLRISVLDHRGDH